MNIARFMVEAVKALKWAAGEANDIAREVMTDEERETFEQKHEEIVSLAASGVRIQRVFEKLEELAAEDSNFDSLIRYTLDHECEDFEERLADGGIEPADDVDPQDWHQCCDRYIDGGDDSGAIEDLEWLRRNSKNSVFCDAIRIDDWLRELRALDG